MSERGKSCLPPLTQPPSDALTYSSTLATPNSPHPSLAAYLLQQLLLLLPRSPPSPSPHLHSPKNTPRAFTSADLLLTPHCPNPFTEPDVGRPRIDRSLAQANQTSQIQLARCCILTQLQVHQPGASAKSNGRREFEGGRRVTHRTQRVKRGNFGAIARQHSSPTIWDIVCLFLLLLFLGGVIFGRYVPGWMSFIFPPVARARHYKSKTDFSSPDGCC